MYLAPGFQSSSLALSSAYGASGISAVGLQVPSLSLSLSGVGDASLSGTIGDASATLTGTGALYLDELTGTLSLNASGINDVYVTAGSDAATITGAIKGIGTVKHAGGTCNVTGPFSFFASTCESVTAAVASPPEEAAYWTCGLNVTGAFRCSGQGLALQSTDSGSTVVSSGVGSQPEVGSATRNTSAYDLAGDLSTGTYQQSGSVGTGGSTAVSNTQGTGDVSSTAVAGGGQSTTSSTVNGETVTNTVSSPAAFSATGASLFPPSPAATVANAASTASASASASASATASAGASPDLSAFTAGAFSNIFGTPAFTAPAPEPAPEATASPSAAASTPASGTSSTATSVSQSLGNLSVRTYNSSTSNGVAASLACAVSKVADVLPWMTTE